MAKIFRELLNTKCPRWIGRQSAILFLATIVPAMAEDSSASQESDPSFWSAERETLTGDWFGQGQAMRAAGFDLRLESTQFYQGLTQGNGDKSWQWGNKWDARLRVDFSKWGLWEGFSATVQGYLNQGWSVNGSGGTILPVNWALGNPGIQGADRSDLAALYLHQDVGVVSIMIGKLNLPEFARSTPLRGGGGVDTFWSINLASAVNGLTSPSIYAARMEIRTQPVSWIFQVFDPQNAVNAPLFESLFRDGVSLFDSATYKTEILGRTGYYGVKGGYSTKEGPDLSELVPSAINGVVIDKKGAYFIDFNFQQYLVQDPEDPRRGWGIFGDFTYGGGNPNVLQWSTSIGIGGNSLVPGRPDDRFGVSYFYFGFSDPLIQSLKPVFNLRAESGVELFYNFAVTKALRVDADLQFIKPASGDYSIAMFAGLSTYIKF